MIVLVGNLMEILIKTILYVSPQRCAKNKVCSSVLNHLNLVDIYLVVRVPDCGDRKNKLFIIQLLKS